MNSILKHMNLVDSSNKSIGINDTEIWETPAEYSWNSGLSLKWCDPNYFVEILLASLFDTPRRKIAWLKFAADIWDAVVGESSHLFTLTTQGDIKTNGYILSGGIKSGEGVWTIDPRGNTWKMRYGTSAASDSSKFFGVAIPPGSGSDYDKGIRFNYGKRAVTINGTGLRFYQSVKNEKTDQYEWKHLSTLNITDAGQLNIRNKNIENSIYGNKTSFYLTHKNNTDAYAYLGFNSKNGIYLRGAEYGSTGENMRYIDFDLETHKIYMYDNYRTEKESKAIKRDVYTFNASKTVETRTKNSETGKYEWI
jgi:hypothetical protein